ncbi:hypothetical protein ACFQ4N_02545 [Oceanobacillus iheyensis]|uniref:hypothetical protein n=1 Tax=Oceanobacillus iheyensis TaxID=182710 RepID=UPI0036304C44
MVNTFIKKNKDIKKNNIFSFKKGLNFFVISNILLLSFMGIFLINSGTNVTIIGFLVSGEVFLILLFLIACLKPKESKKTTLDKDQSKEWVALLITFIILSLFSLIFIGLSIPYPSTIVMLVLITNFMVALYSIVFHPVAIAIYEANVFGKKTSLLDYIFKYIAIFFSGINYYVQKILLKLPLILNKLIAIVFVLVLLWQAALILGIFD